ncbi:MAG: hypothetical protein AAGA75_05305 [Cyanobacteria bacterium P01_E01_bin.6]
MNRKAVANISDMTHGVVRCRAWLGWLRLLSNLISLAGNDDDADDIGKQKDVIVNPETATCSEAGRKNMARLKSHLDGRSIRAIALLEGGILQP